MQWLCEDGHLCRPGEIIAYCNIGVAYRGGLLFGGEFRDLQAAFAPRVGGRLKISPTSSRGGFMDLLPHYGFNWRPDFTIGHIEVDPDKGAVEGPQDQLRLLIMAGRRMSQLAEIRPGLLTGWHDRKRAWTAEMDGRQGTLLGLGICEQVGVIRGERVAFSELFEAAHGPAQVVYRPGEPLVQCAPVLREQLLRTPGDHQAIADDIARTFATAPAPGPADWMFMGALLSNLADRPIGEPYEILTRAGGLSSVGPADTVLLSVNAEPNVVLRHKRLGYALHFHGFRLNEQSPRIRAWLKEHFEPDRRGVDDILRDYADLIDAARASSPGGRGPAILIMNRMSSAGFEDIQTYAAFDRPMGDTLDSVRGKELNLMLHDLAAMREVSIVDADAIGAELGGWAHIVDGVHQSGPMQAEIRAEILHIMASRRAVQPVAATA